jgi:hypothetical protein
MGRTVLGIAMILVLSGCAVVPKLTEAPGLDQALHVENRGGPAFEIRIGNADVIDVECNGGEAIRPRDGNAPGLPWELTIVRIRDGSTIFARRVDRLPQWFVQIGEEPLGMSEQPILGPAGPACPPSG